MSKPIWRPSGMMRWYLITVIVLLVIVLVRGRVL